MRTDANFGRSAILRVSTVLLAGLLAAGCERTILDAPTGQEILSWTTPYDKSAAEAAMPYYREADLSDYTFSVLLFVQNYNKAGLAVTLEVNGQSFERRYIAAETQEVFEITPEMVQQTEAILGLSSTDAEARLLGRSCPFLVRLRQYVTEDQYVIQNTDMVLAPQNFFESQSTSDDFPYDTQFTIDGHIVCPGAFALAVRESHVDVIELDREFVGLNESGDDTDIVVDADAGDISGIPFEYHPATIDALTRLGLQWIIDGG